MESSLSQIDRNILLRIAGALERISVSMCDLSFKTDVIVDKLKDVTEKANS